MNYHLLNSSKFYHFLEKSESPRITAGFSRVEDYSEYKGLNRYSSKPYEYNIYAKIYIRVDNKRAAMKRTYEDFLEFFADNAEIFSAIYEVLSFILGFYAQFKANHSITKKLFFLKELKIINLKN